MSPAEARVLFEAVQLVARATIKAMKADGFNIGMNNGRAAGEDFPFSLSISKLPSTWTTLHVVTHNNFGFPRLILARLWPGQTVDHVHVHIIPRFNNDDFWCTRRPQAIPTGTPKTVDELEVHAETIRNEINRLLRKRMSKL